MATYSMFNWRYMHFCGWFLINNKHTSAYIYGTLFMNKSSKWESKSHKSESITEVQTNLKMFCSPRSRWYRNFLYLKQCIYCWTFTDVRIANLQTSHSANKMKDNGHPYSATEPCPFCIQILPNRRLLGKIISISHFKIQCRCLTGCNFSGLHPGIQLSLLELANM